ncbi:DUF1971 domain-containing protein [Candidatus Berkiella cookevillensis]|uniref:DUF1971 domain-containing protein n=1 Tax=Candidatus Berkiella cookevillensis TaxID=437022 RepID=A0A0Q9YQA0_9GAMM|nr:DUF1971 domain-containing protein [Candidatus Berkiella cookevillensis]MCS5708692.1 DUF1971 domain-containing protein [Candidatus Berkiella cookevillensis]
MKILPNDLMFYKRTPTFTHESVPPGLLKNHSTKKNVWGLIKIMQGKLDYIIGTNETYLLEPGKDGVIEPEVIHHVSLTEPVEFFVEFYK